jgi:hypothetical protein
MFFSDPSMSAHPEVYSLVLRLGGKAKICHGMNDHAEVYSLVLRLGGKAKICHELNDHVFF